MFSYGSSHLYDYFLLNICASRLSNFQGVLKFSYIYLLYFPLNIPLVLWVSSVILVVTSRVKQLAHKFLIFFFHFLIYAFFYPYFFTQYYFGCLPVIFDM